MSSPGKALHLYPSNEYSVLPRGCEAHWEVVERILFIYAKLNPGIAYVQGMNEIVGPIYYTFATDPNDQWKGELWDEGDWNGRVHHSFKAFNESFY